MLILSLKSLKGFSCLVASFFVLCFTACNKEETFIDLPLGGPIQVFYTVSGNTLLRFNAQNVKQPEAAPVNITNLSATTERILSIDFRPHTGELYGLSNLNKIYVINVTSGVARAIGPAFTPALETLIASIDFNPAADKIRLVTATGQNLRINPENGQVISTDTPTPINISAIAYDKNIAGTNTTTLFDLDLVAKKLYKQIPPNNGTLQEVGNLGLDLGTNVSFDISPDGTNALAVGRTPEGARLFTIDLTTGKAKLVGKFASTVNIQSIAIPTNPVAYAVEGNNFIVFNPTITNTPTIKPITGLLTGETIVGLDIRPFNGQIFAVSSSSRLYAVDAATAAFTFVAPISPVLIGTKFGVNFNPALDYLSLISNNGQNLSITLIGGVIANSPVPNTANISAIAYNNNFVNAAATSLFGIDATSDKLYSIVPTTGVLTEIGELKVDATAVNGFDIISTNSANTAYAILTVTGKQKTYTINLTTGVATLTGEINGSFTAFTLGLRFPN